MKLEFSRQIFEKILKHQISWKSVQWESNCSIRTGMTKLSHFSQFCEHTWNEARKKSNKKEQKLSTPTCMYSVRGQTMTVVPAVTQYPLPPIGHHFPRRDLRTSWDHTTYVQQVRRRVTGVTVIRHAVTGYVFSIGASSDAFGMHLVLESWPEAIYSAWGFPSHPESLPPFRVEGVHEWDYSSASGQRNLLRCFSLYNS